MLGEINFNPQVLAPFFSWTFTRFSLGSGQTYEILGDANRVLVAVSCTVGGQVIVTPRIETGTIVGLYAQQASAPLVLRYSDYGAFVGANLFIRHTALLAEGAVLLVSYTPQR